MNGVNNIPTAAFNTFVWSDELFLTQFLCKLTLSVHNFDLCIHFDIINSTSWASVFLALKATNLCSYLNIQIRK